MHRNTQKRYYQESLYFITCNTQDKLPFFRNEEYCKIFINTIKNVQPLKSCKIIAFCINYDHFHLIVEPNNQIANISQIMQSLKRNSSRDINKVIELEKKSDFSMFRWQKSFHDHIIRDKSDYFKHFIYTENNYIKHGLPQNWKYTSAKISL